MGDGDSAKDEWVLSAFGFSVAAAGQGRSDARAEEEERDGDTAESSRMEDGHPEHDKEESAETLEAEGHEDAEATALAPNEAEAPEQSHSVPDQEEAEQSSQEESGQEEEEQEGQSAPSWKAARQAWQDANDAVNDQINGLRAKLLERAGAGDDGVEGLAEALHEIADAGLNGITEDHRVKLMISLASIGDGALPAMRKSGPKALAEIARFQAFLDKSEMIAVCDANPFGAPVSIKATLTPPLRQMAAALKAAAAP